MPVLENLGIQQESNFEKSIKFQLGWPLGLQLESAIQPAKLVKIFELAT